MTTSLPEHPVAATLVADPPHWTLRIQRTFPQDRATVWRAITDPDQLARWTPFRPSRALTSTGPVRFQPTDGSDEVDDTEVRAVTSQESLAFLWGADRLRFGLFETDGGTLLTLAHTMDDHNAAPSMAAGWHLCLGALELILKGEEAPSVVGQNAMNYGWEELERAYSELFDGQTDRSIPGDETEES